MVSERKIPLKITIDGRPERAETIVYCAGAYVLALVTTLPDRVLSLHSTYTGAAGAGTLASHLLLARNGYQAIAAEHDHDILPLTHQRRRLLYDHLQRLQELLSELGLDVRPSVEDRVIDVIEP
jgi:glycine/D-amino acid oxidase-like deaminating enzyme